MKNFLDILSASGRLIFYTRGVCKCVKEVAIVSYRIYNATGWTLWATPFKEINEEL